MWADEEKMQKMIRKIPKDVKICDVARSKFVWQDALDFWTITQFFLLHIIDMQGLEMSGVWELRFWHFAGPFRLDPVQRTEPSVFEAVLKLFWNLKLQSILALGQLRPSHHTIWNCSQHWEDHAPNQAGNLPAPQDPRWYHSCSTRVSDAVLQILRLDHCNPLHTIALLGDHLSYCVFRCIEMLAGCFRSGVSLPFYNSGMSLFRGETKSAVRCLEQHSLCYPCCSCTSCGAWQSKATQRFAAKHLILPMPARRQSCVNLDICGWHHLRWDIQRETHKSVEFPFPGVCEGLTIWPLGILLSILKQCTAPTFIIFYLLSCGSIILVSLWLFGRSGSVTWKCEKIEKYATDFWH